MSANLKPCPACGSEQVTLLLERRRVPVQQNVLKRTRELARAIPRGDLILQRCDACALVANVAFDPALLRYDDDYDNNQVASPAFEAHVDGRVSELLRQGAADGKTVVEVGCGKGYFLRRLCERGGARGFGFDTSYVGPEVDEQTGVHFYRQYFSAAALPLLAGKHVQSVICRHVIEHVTNPVELLRGIAPALGSAPPSKLFFETPDLRWIVQNGVFWDFFYEHCCYFTGGALGSMFRQAGLRTLSIERVFDGQYLWLGAESQPPNEAFADDDGADLGTSIARTEQKLVEWRASVARMAARGRLAVWGAGAKGVTFVNLVDPDVTDVVCVVDINENKQGCYVPGTGHRIVGVEALRSEAITDVVIMNPNYLDESRALADRVGASPRFHIAE